jgi:hypothetical protein
MSDIKKELEKIAKQLGVPQHHHVREEEADEEITKSIEQEVQHQPSQGHINPRSRLVDFFDIRIGEIAPQTRQKMKEEVTTIRKKLKILKKNLENY